MNDDELDRAIAALRDDGDRPAPQARRTRDRILRDLRPRRRAQRWPWAVPLAALLAGGAALAATGRLTRAFDAATHLLGLDGAEPQHGPQRTPMAPPADVPVAGPEPEPAAPADVPVAGPEPEPAAPNARTPAPTASTTAAKRPASSVSAPPTPAPVTTEVVAAPGAASPDEPPPVPPAPPSGPDTIALYRKAHALQSTNPAAALTAWDDYLASDPSGPLATDARYERALCLVRLGKKAEAARALAPFAAGKYGNYRRAEAQALIDALKPATP